MSKEKSMIPPINTITILDNIYDLTVSFKANLSSLFEDYITFLKKYKLFFEDQVTSFSDPISIGFISPRLLRDPLSFNFSNGNFSLDEKKSNVFEYIKALTLFIYCVEFNVEGWELINTPFYQKNQIKIFSKNVIDLQFLITEIKNEIGNKPIKKVILQRKSISSTLTDQNISKIDGDYQSEETSSSTIPFTARLMAHYRAEESKKNNPLVTDPMAELLTGDFSEYTSEHAFTAARGDYTIVRTFFIDQLIQKWCQYAPASQIVLLGAGLDTRAYRLNCLKDIDHVIFEIDFESIIQYKEHVLNKYDPLCKITRLALDITKINLKSSLTNKGFSTELPTFWILEGLSYYLEKHLVIEIIKTCDRISSVKSQIFLDVCVPALADLKFGPFTNYFKWGTDINDIPKLFTSTNWEVQKSYADDHDQGRDVGQRGMIFIVGRKI